MRRLIVMFVMMANIFSTFMCASSGDAKLKKIYLGKYYISSYNEEDNTPRNSRKTASGNRATVGRTVAVDRRNPIVPMGSKVYIEGVGTRIVEDTGGFGRFNGGRRKFDVFTQVGKGFLKTARTWLIRPETKTEKRKRIKREKERRKRLLIKKAKEQAAKRKKRQKSTFTLKYDKYLTAWQIVTDPDYIKSGTVRIGYKYLDVKATKKGLGTIILIGDEELKDFEIKTKLDDVYEKAKG